VRFRSPTTDWRDELVLLAPAIVVLALVSSQTGFSRYLRYALPMAPFYLIFIGQVARAFAAHRPVASAIVVFATALSVTSSMAAFPHSLSYFNELIGGPLHGADHILDANIDWGQDLLNLKRWYDAHPEARPLYVQYFGFPSTAPSIAGIDSQRMPRMSGADSPNQATFRSRLEPGWYAISVNDLYGYRHSGSEEPWFSYLLAENPVTMAGYSIRIYHLSSQDVTRLPLRPQLRHAESK
jgi:hypothetical protein